MRNPGVTFAVLLYIILSAFVELQLVERVVPADIILLALIIISLSISSSRAPFRIDTVFWISVPLLTVLTVSAVLSTYPERAFEELLAILLGLFGSIALANLLSSLSEAWFRRFCSWYVVLMGLLAGLCILDFLLLPGLISSRSLGGLQGPFRNTGQAGAFFGVHAAICIAFVTGQLVPRRFLYLMSCLSVVLALVFTLKRAAAVGLAVGLFLLWFQMLVSTSSKERRHFLFLSGSLCFASILGFLTFQWAIENVEGMRWRFDYKFSGETLATFTEDNLMVNIRSALSAFADSPLIGVGLGNVRDVYQAHEIHSTYFGILAYGGILGTTLYALFMFFLLWCIWSPVSSRLSNVYHTTLLYLLPMLIGLMVSWAYTYHLRKREFWTLVAIVVAIRFLSRRTRGSISREPFGARVFKPREIVKVTR